MVYSPAIIDLMIHRGYKRTKAKGVKRDLGCGFCGVVEASRGAGANQDETIQSMQDFDLAHDHADADLAT